MCDMIYQRVWCASIYQQNRQLPRVISPWKHNIRRNSLWYRTEHEVLSPRIWRFVFFGVANIFISRTKVGEISDTDPYQRVIWRTKTTHQNDIFSSSVISYYADFISGFRNWIEVLVMEISRLENCCITDISYHWYDISRHIISLIWYHHITFWNTSAKYWNHSAINNQTKPIHK